MPRQIGDRHAVNVYVIVVVVVVVVAVFVVAYVVVRVGTARQSRGGRSCVSCA